VERVQKREVELIPREAGELVCHPDLDAILVDWPRIAAIAWEGFLLGGRGAVIIEVEEPDAWYAYRPGSPCNCCRETLDGYDPEQEAVVVVRRGETQAIYRLGGWPAPPAAYAVTTADLFEATVN
jgi:hypothetical protein